MVTVLCFLTVLGFELLYHTSVKAQFVRIPILYSWALRDPVMVRLGGVFMLLVCLTGFQLIFGYGSGFFYFLAAVMLAGGLVVILSPIRYFRPHWIGMGFLFLLLLELI